MRRKISTGILFLPVVFILLHAFTPHDHHTPLESATEVAANHTCSSGPLSDLFNFSPGAHHLEEYVVAQPDFDFSSEEVSDLITFHLTWLKPISNQVEATPSIDWDDPLHGSSMSRRGPPKLIA